MFVKNAKVFNKKSIPYNIINTEKEILNVINNCPVVCEIENKEVVVGFVENPYVLMDSIYGDVFIWSKFDQLCNTEVLSQELCFDFYKNTKSIYIKDIIIHIKNK